MIGTDCGVAALVGPINSAKATTFSPRSSRAHASSLLDELDGSPWQVALRYELSGGFIKNAVLSSLMLAVSRDPTAPCITEADVHAGCAVQVLRDNNKCHEYYL